MVGEVLDGRYKIFKKLGEGGMGEVYAADHVHIEKQFAIKLLKAEIVSNAEAVKRFQQEARSASSIKHRNIIGVEDFGRLPDGRIYMCMEFLSGAPLNEMIQQPMGADRLLNILIQSGHGLAAAHAKGITHRDMKPENIFVTQEGNPPNDVPKLLDFGIAKVAGNDGQNNLTRTGTIFGTPFYMAPEQALGNPVDQRTDIYAMGVIMYECFTGSLPFQGESFMGILTQHITTAPEPVAQRASKAGRALPMGIAEIIMRCMDKDPNQRFQTMDELVNALIAVYRAIAGAGMSTYMEAFPVGSAQHMAQPTPSPMNRMTGPSVSSQTVGVGAPPPFQSHGGMPPGHSQPVMPMGHPHPAHTPPPMHGGPHMHGGPMQSGVAPAVGQSGLYDPSGSSHVSVPKKSNVGVVIAIIVLLAAGGGIAAVVVLGGGKDKKNDAAGAGSGSDANGLVATNSTGSGSAGGAEPHDKGSAAAATPDKVATPDAGAPDKVEPDQAGSGSGTGSAGGTTPDATGSGGTSATPAAQTIDVLLITNADVFEVWEGGKQVLVGPDNLPITKGTPRTVTLKAKGFKDKTITVDGATRKVKTKLARVPGQTTTTTTTNTNTGTGAGKMDCSKKIVDSKSPQCRKQYCSAHPGVPICETLDDDE
jgi:eukaryotic-like serine/threonine-protein kinase